MENKINIAKILSNCPRGMELDCSIYNKVTLINVDDREDIVYPIRVFREDGNTIALTKYGQYTDADFAKCVIYPKGKTTWDEFVPPCKFKDGDIVYVKTINHHEYILIFKEIKNDHIHKYVCFTYQRLSIDKCPVCLLAAAEIIRLATEEEKKKLFDAIKENGHKWNAETKTLEKLIEPKFKVGDKVVKKDNPTECWYVQGVDTNCNLDYFYHIVAKGKIANLHFKEQDNWELVSNKFDINTLVPFESRVLVRHNKDNKWCGSFFSHIDGNLHSHCYKYVTIAGKSYPMCIPYEGNEHLLGTTNDCIEYYKTWQ